MDEQQEVELELLREFYNEVCELTVQHDAENDAAIVYVDKLDKALSRVNPKWWEAA